MNRENIYVIYGNTPREMVKEILNRARVGEEVSKEALIGIKPNLVVAKPSTSGATTSPELVAGVIEYLQSEGFKNIVILEGAWVGDRTASAFKVCGYEKLSERYGVPLIDLQKDSYRPYKVEGMEINVCDKVMEVDYLINMPVLKGHCQTRMTCALKNMKGCLPNSEKRKFHTMGLHKPIAFLNKIIRNGLIIVDGLMGDLNFEEGGNPVQMDRVILGKDPVLIDSYVAELMGIELSEVPYITLAEKIGVGTTKLRDENIIEINNNKNIKKIPKSNRVQKLARHIEERDACSACYGSLIHALERLDDSGELRNVREKIYIGQGYKGIEGKGIGVGVCTRGFEVSVQGCPPKAKDIIECLKNNS